MFPSRKRFRFQVAPSDRQLWAIGMVVVQWTQIETWVTVFVHALTEGDDAARKKFDSTRAFQKRVDQWEEASRLSIAEPHLSALLLLINRVRTVQEQRDKIVHGSWASKDAAALEADGPANWAKPHSLFTWRLDFGGIRKVAETIDTLHYNLTGFLFQSAGHAKTFTVSDALRRIYRKPNRP